MFYVYIYNVYIFIYSSICYSFYFYFLKFFYHHVYYGLGFVQFLAKKTEADMAPGSLSIVDFSFNAGRQIGTFYEKRLVEVNALFFTDVDVNVLHFYFDVCCVQCIDR